MTHALGDRASTGDDTISTINGIGTALVGSKAGDPTASAQAAADPLRPPGRDGWTPDRIIAVTSKNTGGFAGSALKFALGGVDEQPGQRLSTAQVDAFAPFYAKQFGLDETFVRQELAKVYFYLGGPVPAGNAMTIGHHIFVPDSKSLTTILSPGGTGWLAHELAHTMQYLSYENGSPHHFLADYITGLMVGKDPLEPATGGGPPVWGSAFTGINLAGGTEDNIADQQLSAKARFTSGLLPAATLGIPVGLAAGGLLTAARATSVRPLLGHTPGAFLGLQVLAAPALVGAAAGTFSDKVGEPFAQTVGTIAGAGIASLAVWRSGAFSPATTSAVAHTPVGRGIAIGAGVAAILVGAGAGWLGATATSNTVNGASHNAAILEELARSHTGDKRTLDYQASLHDAHWQEIDAEALSRQYLHANSTPTDGTDPVTGRTPDMTKGTTGDRFDWGLKIPMIVGIPAAILAGTGVLAGRTGRTLLDATIRDGKGPVEAVRAALHMLGGTRGGLVNSMGVGGAVTLAPLMVGGFVGPIVQDITGSSTAARLSGAGAAATVGGTLVTLLMRGRGGSMQGRLAAIGAATVISGAVGLLASGIATDATHPSEQKYDVAKGVTAGTKAATAEG
ncbi:MAG: hypothetical protein JWN72_2201 [Thermoleophilia bacterium]|nr:hypothetical protein [Thermoleophilia bacterium]